MSEVVQNKNKNKFCQRDHRFILKLINSNSIVKIILNRSIGFTLYWTPVFTLLWTMRKCILLSSHRHRSPILCLSVRLSIFNRSCIKPRFLKNDKANQATWIVRNQFEAPVDNFFVYLELDEWFGRSSRPFSVDWLQKWLASATRFLDGKTNWNGFLGGDSSSPCRDFKGALLGVPIVHLHSTTGLIFSAKKFWADQFFVSCYKWSQ